MDKNDRVFSYARMLAPFAVGIIGACIGGFASFTITKYEVMQHGVAIEKLEARVSVIESGQSTIIAKLASLEAKADLLLAGYKR